MPGLLIVGAGGHGKVVAEAAELMEKWDRISFLDDREELKEVLGFPVIGKTDALISFKGEFRHVFIAIGHNRTRVAWLNKAAQAGFRIPVIIHPSSAVSKYSTVGEGTAVMAGSVINVHAVLGKGCIVNTCASIDHDCVLGDGVHVSPGAHVSGNVTIGEDSWVCAGSSIKNGITIGRHVIVAAGAAVIRDVPDQVMVAGVPAESKKHIF
jgi:sugar O-acyltransferase (sialic acid O-acetyltransferase NeuD family)